MLIIGLYGHGNCGKSETLNEVKELLREKGRSISAKPHPLDEKPETFEYKDMIVCAAPGGDDKAKLFQGKEVRCSNHCHSLQGWICRRTTEVCKGKRALK